MHLVKHVIFTRLGLHHALFSYIFRCLDHPCLWPLFRLWGRFLFSLLRTHITLVGHLSEPSCNSTHLKQSVEPSVVVPMRVVVGVRVELGEGHGSKVLAMESTEEHLYSPPASYKEGQDPCGPCTVSVFAPHKVLSSICTDQLLQGVLLLNHQIKIQHAQQHQNA